MEDDGKITATTSSDDCGCGLGDGCQWDGTVPPVSYDDMTPVPSCSLCQDEGWVAVNFDLRSPERPSVERCPACNGS